MTQNEDATPDGVEDSAAAGGSEANASGPQPQSEDDADLTVDDILNAAQNDAAQGAGDDPAENAADASDAEGAAEPEAGSDAAGYLDDLRRLTAEYANYRKRTEANAAIEKQRAVAAAVTPLLPVLDDLDRAEQHGDLAEGSAFATIAQKLRSSLEKLGLESYGEKGEAFDPQRHEAIAQVPVPGTEGQVVLDVVERGYRIGDVELRAAKVAVAVEADG